MKRNPRKLNWTLFYRRLRKKGTQVRVSCIQLCVRVPGGAGWCGDGCLIFGVGTCEHMEVGRADERT
jgi:hypothetical protein